VYDTITHALTGFRLSGFMNKLNN